MRKSKRGVDTGLICTLMAKVGILAEAKEDIRRSDW